MHYLSDYSSGSGTSLDSYSWGGSQSLPTPQSQLSALDQTARGRSVSYADVSHPARTHIDRVMEEFRLNGVDSPYDPDSDGSNRRAASMVLQPSAYLSKTTRAAHHTAHQMSHPTPVLPALDHGYASAEHVGASAATPENITAEQYRVLSSLPRVVVRALLQVLRSFDRPPQIDENRGCAFCRANGERVSYYQSHSLRRGGRVTCPVLREHVCARCGATGDSAHTNNYCPLASQLERERSAAIMRSVRMSSERRRWQRERGPARLGQAAPSMSPAVTHGDRVYSGEDTLDPVWAELEKKLTQ
ncbi:PREDICTED: uncharacterized protein LOC106127550 [Papilio xuthus]|uniref:Uncharacterized protein LOC106127550 n=1 Tax=Papilio xuthus TaxID=66420 RepID=A0AAJ7EKP0_PAPXU|nr:PREDICTED: uncharacterized protein LOC106127550 [Papilio xuthus]